MSKIIPALSIAVTVGLFAAGCASQPAADKAKSTSAEYEYVTPLGSNIPVRVKKGQTATTSSPTATMTGDEAARVLNGAGNQRTQSGGQP